MRAGNEALKNKLSKINQGESPISDAALRLVKGLDELKGAAMKAGQILSMVDESLLPPGWKDALVTLQSNATAKDWSFIEPILISELGSLNHFSEIEPKAVHAASIGQVHKARLLDGTEVALKVQYPNLEENVHSDLQNIKKLFKVANIIPNLSNYDQTFQAVEKLFYQELDFLREKEFYEFYKKKFAQNPDIIVPDTFPKLCTKRVLTTEWINGENLNHLMDKHGENLHTDPKLIQLRDKLGYLLLSLVFTEIIELKHIQSDPNPGNFLVTEDEKLVLLDFGATQELSAELVHNYALLCKWSLEENFEKTIEAAKKIGFIFESDSAETCKIFIDVMKIAMEPFYKESYSWKDCHLLKRINTESFHYMKQTKYRAPDSEVLFMNRRLGGNLLIMERLGPSIKARNLFKEILKND